MIGSDAVDHNYCQDVEQSVGTVGFGSLFRLVSCKCWSCACDNDIAVTASSKCGYEMRRNRVVLTRSIKMRLRYLLYFW